MRELKITMGSWDLDQLQDELKAALGNRLISISTYALDRPIVVRVDDSATAADETQVSAVCAAHVPRPPAAPADPLATLRQAVTDLQNRVKALEAKGG